MFARLANGNVAPTRVIEGQATNLSRTMHGIAYDAIHERLGPGVIGEQVEPAHRAMQAHLQRIELRRAGSNAFGNALVVRARAIRVIVAVAGLVACYRIGIRDRA